MGRTSVLDRCFDLVVLLPLLPLLPPHSLIPLFLLTLPICYHTLPFPRTLPLRWIAWFVESRALWPRRRRLEGRLSGFGGGCANWMVCGARGFANPLS